MKNTQSHNVKESEEKIPWSIPSSGSRPTNRQKTQHRLKHDLLGGGNDYSLNLLTSILTIEFKHICGRKSLNSFFSIAAYWGVEK